MFKKTIAALTTGVVISAASVSAQAATATFTFNDSFRTQTASSYSFTEGGVTLDISSKFWVFPGAIWDGGAIRTTTANGIEIIGGGADPDSLIDSSGNAEVVQFDFSQDVTLKEITFTQYEDGDVFHLFYDRFDNDTLAVNVDGLDANPTAGIFDFSVEDAHKLYGDMFGIGAIFGGNNEFGIASLTVEYGNISAVPLPPAFLLFAAALGGLGLFSRRRKSA